MNQRFIPGARSRFNKVYTYTVFKEFDTCACFQSKADQIKTGWNDASQTENLRIAQIISNNLGGKITFGNYGISGNINYLGRTEGQPGGSLQALRNRF